MSGTSLVPRQYEGTDTECPACIGACGVPTMRLALEAPGMVRPASRPGREPLQRSVTLTACGHSAAMREGGRYDG